MTDKLPAPCEHCHATGLFHGSECVECRGKGLPLDDRWARDVSKDGGGTAWTVLICSRPVAPEAVAS